jgi:hypothetical protein
VLFFLYSSSFRSVKKKNNKIKGNLERTRSFQCEHPWRIIAVESREGNVYDFKQNVFLFFFFFFLFLKTELSLKMSNLNHSGERSFDTKLDDDWIFVSHGIEKEKMNKFSRFPSVLKIVFGNCGRKEGSGSAFDDLSREEMAIKRGRRD